MAQIKILPIHLVNKIAAGECIERPSSVVKELIENALDAGAGKIDVTIEQGGSKLIRVVDDAAGIEPDELPVAVTPHATSKLFDENDLYTISTMGFRGEALASIAAVSMTRISSVRPEARAGGSIEVIDGQCSAVRPYAGAGGTIVEVQNLFYNTPARRKFLKTPATEFGHIQEQIIRTALACPRIAFHLQHNGRTVLELPPAETLRDRIGDVFGPELAGPLMQVFVQDGTLGLEAYVCRPEDAKPSARWQYFFVNRRPVRDRYISHALREAYRGLIVADRQPIAFVYLDVDPTLVDVNVHPTKSEVRFVDPGQIHSLVLGSIRDRFLSTDFPARLMPDAVPEPGSPSGQGRDAAGLKQSVTNALADFLRNTGSTQPNFKFDAPRAASKPTSGAGQRFPDDPAVITGPRQAAEPEPVEQAQAGMGPSLSSPALQIHNTYLVVETAEGFMIIDQHALHERVLYQQLCDRLKTGSLPRQRLLVPQVVHLTGQQMAQLDAIKSKLNDVGIEVELFGPRSIGVHSLPALVDQVDAGKFIEDLLGRLEEQIEPEAEQTVEHILQSLACKAAVKAGDPLKPEEIQTLLDYREQIDLTSSCPHGRPTALQMTLAELQKRFKRT
jgi:DNA mismatch repair protein MutL